MTQLSDPYQIIDLSPDGPRKLLAFNAGSLSLRWDYFDTADASRRISGKISGLGGMAQHRVSGAASLDERVEAPDLRAAVDLALDQLAAAGLVGPGGEGLSGVGHRVLFASDRPGSAARLDDALVRQLMKAGFEPWGQQRRLQALVHARERLSEVPHFAVWDGAFFQTLPEFARLYGLPYRYYKQYGLQRLGFQGLSHKYVGMRAALHLGEAFESLEIVSLHMGNGVSLTAIDHGRAVDTSMGLTPLSGPVQGQRCGDVDPGLLLHLMEVEGAAPERLARMLERESGLLGLSGISNDMQTLLEAAERGDARALLAIEVFCHRVRRTAGAMASSLDEVDALVFTGGIGEHSAGTRARICQGLSHLGVVLDDAANQRGLDGAEAATLHHPDSKVQVLVVDDDEARMIARETVRALTRGDLNRTVLAAQERPIPIGVSAHHVHLTQAHVEALFGAGHELTPKAPLKQPGQFAAEERVDLVGPRGSVERVRVLGPVRSATQVEISRTEEFQLGIDAPVRNSGDVADTPGLLLKGPAGQVELAEGVICARRHIHMHPDDVAHFGVHDRDVVMVEVGGDRKLVFGDVLIRAKESYVLEMHVDTDEANAAELSSGMTGRLVGIQSRPS